MVVEFKISFWLFDQETIISQDHGAWLLSLDGPPYCSYARTVINIEWYWQLGVAYFGKGKFDDYYFLGVDKVRT